MEKIRIVCNYINNILWSRIGYCIALIFLMSFPALFIGGNHVTISLENFIAAILQSFVFALVLAFIDALLNSSKYWRISIVTIISLFALIDVWCCFVIHTRPLSYLFDLVYETETQEVREFMTQYVYTYTTLVLIVSTIIIAFACYKLMSWKVRSPKKYKCIQMLFFLMAVAISLFSFFYVSNKEGGHFGARNSIQIVMKAFIERTDYAQNILNIESALDRLEIGTCTYYSPKIILIIGESHSRLHSSLYDYNVETMPNMEREMEQGNLFRLDSVTTPIANTGKVLAQLFSMAPLSDKQSWSTYPLFPAVFKSLGYYVGYFDNQSARYSLRDYYDLNSTYFLTTNKINDACFSFRNNAIYEYDERMIDYSFNQNPQEKMMIIYHLMGQHLLAKNRYPEQFNHFTKNDYSHRTDLNDNAKEQLAAYDNATRYLDYNLNKIINHYRNDDVVIVYISDHGEEVYDTRVQYGRTIDSADICMLDVPAFVWCSDKYLETRPEMRDILHSYQNKPLMNVDVSNYLIKFANIEILSQ